jgi:hypothetical protein
LAGLALLVLAAIGAFLWLPGRSLPRNLLAAVPETATAALSIRVARVLNSPVYEKLVVQRGQDRGVQRLQKLCGFHPLRGIDEALVFAMPSTDKPRVAVLARGAIPHTDLIRCVNKLGRNGSSDLVQEEIEGITTLRSKNGSTRAAFIGSDGLVAGDAEGVKAAIETFVGKRTSLEADALLAPLYHERAEANDLTLVARIAENQALVTRGVAALGLDPAQLDAAGLSALAADVHLDNERVSASAVLLTREPARARALAEAAEGMRARIVAFPALSLTGFGQPLRELRLESTGTRVLARGSIPVRTLAAALEIVPALTSLRKGLAASPAAPVGDAGAARADPEGDDDEDEDAP